MPESREMSEAARELSLLRAWDSTLSFYRTLRHLGPRLMLGSWCLRPWFVPYAEEAERALDAHDADSRSGGYWQGRLTGARNVLAPSAYAVRLSRKELHADA